LRGRRQLLIRDRRGPTTLGRNIRVLGGKSIHSSLLGTEEKPVRGELAAAVIFSSKSRAKTEEAKSTGYLGKWRRLLPGKTRLQLGTQAKGGGWRNRGVPTRGN